MELVGRQFGHLRVTEVIGQGGMGDVYAAWDEKLERKVALKVLNADQRLDDESRGRLLREARSLSKLDHSNICRIHDYIEGADDGEVDLLVLEYIDGQTLHDALEKGLMPRAEKLRIAMKVAEVLIDAHRAGIVHRDLKPENVMLTKSGEVKVLDFGLARWFNKARSQQVMIGDEPARLPIRSQENVHLGDTMELESAPSLRTPSGRREFQGTAIGITLGTPIFMSPEQARGEDLTPASDMFSFGLLLQTLFTGKDPHPVDISAREVILRVARGETLPVENAPRDVTTLINRLKRFAPADRPTAVETLERLQFFADKPQRIIRRSIAAAVALVLLIGAWRYMVDLRRERAIAIAERAEAQQRRAQVEDLLEFMLGDLRKKLEPVGRLDILDDVGQRALEYVSSLEPAKMSVDELVRNAKALNQIGEVRIGQGRLAEARSHFERSFVLADAAARRNERHAEALLVRGATNFWIGEILRREGKHDPALERMQAYLRDANALVALAPEKREYQLEKAYGHNNIGALLEAKGNLTDALAEYQSSAAIRETLMKANPGDLQTRADLAQAENKLVALLYKRGDVRESMAHSNREIAIWRELTATHPEHTVWKRHLATSLAFLAQSYETTGADESALRLREEQLKIQRNLVDHDPQNVAWRVNAAVTTSLIAAGIADARPMEALRMHRDALDVLAGVANRQDATPFQKTTLFFAQQRFGRALVRAGQVRAGVQQLHNALQTAEALPANLEASVCAASAAMDIADAMSPRDGTTAAGMLNRAERELNSVADSLVEPRHLRVYAAMLVRRGRLAEARAVRVHLEKLGHDTTELQQLCKSAGC